MSVKLARPQLPSLGLHMIVVLVISSLRSADSNSSSSGVAMDIYHASSSALPVFSMLSLTGKSTAVFSRPASDDTGKIPVATTARTTLLSSGHLSSSASGFTVPFQSRVDLLTQSSTVHNNIIKTSSPPFGLFPFSPTVEALETSFSVMEMTTSIPVDGSSVSMAISPTATKTVTRPPPPPIPPTLPSVTTIQVTAALGQPVSVTPQIPLLSSSTRTVVVSSDLFPPSFISVSSTVIKLTPPLSVESSDLGLLETLSVRPTALFSVSSTITFSSQQFSYHQTSAISIKKEPVSDKATHLFVPMTTLVLPSDLLSSVDQPHTISSIGSVTKSIAIDPSVSFPVVTSQTVTGILGSPILPTLPVMTMQATPTVFSSVPVTTSHNVTKPASVSTVSSNAFLVETSLRAAARSSDIFLETSLMRPTALLSVPSSPTQFSTLKAMISSLLPSTVHSETFDSSLKSTAIVAVEILSASTEISHSVTSAVASPVESSLFSDVVTTSVMPQFSSIADIVGTSTYVPTVLVSLHVTSSQSVMQPTPVPSVSSVPVLVLLETSSMQPTSLLSVPLVASQTQSLFISALNLISSSPPLIVSSETTDFLLQPTAIVSTEILSVNTGISHSDTSATAASVESSLFPDVTTSIVPQFSSTTDIVETGIYGPTVTVGSVSPTVTRLTPSPAPPTVPMLTTFQVTPTVLYSLSVTSSQQTLVSSVSSDVSPLDTSAIRPTTLFTMEGTEMVSSTAFAVPVSSTPVSDIFPSDTSFMTPTNLLSVPVVVSSTPSVSDMFFLETSSVKPTTLLSVPFMTSSQIQSAFLTTMTLISSSLPLAVSSEMNDLLFQSTAIVSMEILSVSTEISHSVTSASALSVESSLFPDVTTSVVPQLSSTMDIVETSTYVPTVTQRVVSRTATRPPPPVVPPSLPSLTTLQLTPTFVVSFTVTSSQSLMQSTPVSDVSSDVLLVETSSVKPTTLFTAERAKTVTPAIFSSVYVSLSSTPVSDLSSEMVILETSSIRPTTLLSIPMFTSSQPEFPSMMTTLTSVSSSLPSPMPSETVDFPSKPSAIVSLEMLSKSTEISHSVSPSTTQQTNTGMAFVSSTVSLLAAESSTKSTAQLVSVRSSTVTSTSIKQISPSSVQTFTSIRLPTSSLNETTTFVTDREATKGPISSTELLSTSFATQTPVGVSSTTTSQTTRTAESAQKTLVLSPLSSSSQESTQRSSVSSVPALPLSTLALYSSSLQFVQRDSVLSTSTLLLPTPALSPSSSLSVPRSLVLSASDLPRSTPALISASSVLLIPNTSISSLPTQVEATSLQVTVSLSSTKKSISTTVVTVLPVTATSVSPVVTNSSSILPHSSVTIQSSTGVGITTSFLSTVSSTLVSMTISTGVSGVSFRPEPTTSVSTVSPHTTVIMATSRTMTLQIMPSTLIPYSILSSLPNITEKVTFVPPTTAITVATVIPTVGIIVTDFQAEIEIIVTNLRQSIGTDEWRALMEENLETAYLEARDLQSLQTSRPPAESNGGSSPEQARRKRNAWEWLMKSPSRSKRESDTVDVTIVGTRQTPQDTTIVTFTIVDGGENKLASEICDLFNLLGVTRLSEILDHEATVACRVVGATTEPVIGGGDDGLDTWIIAILVVGLVLLLTLLGVLYCCWRSHYTGKHRISATPQTVRKQEKSIEDGSAAVNLKVYRQVGDDQLARRMPATSVTRFQNVSEEEEEKEEVIDEADEGAATPVKQISPPAKVSPAVSSSSGASSLIDVKSAAKRDILQNLRMPPAPREPNEDIFAVTETPPGEYNDINGGQHPAAVVQPSAHMSAFELQPKQQLRRYSSLRAPQMLAAASSQSPNKDSSASTASSQSPNKDSDSHSPSSEQLAEGNQAVQTGPGDKDKSMFAEQIALDEFQRQQQQKEDEQAVILHQQEMRLQQAIKQKADLERWRNKQRQRDKERTLNRERHRREQQKRREEKSQELRSRKRQQQMDWSKAQTEFGAVLNPEATQLDALTTSYLSKPRRRHGKPRHWKRYSKTGPHPMADTVRQPGDWPRLPEQLRRPEEIPQAHKAASNHAATAGPFPIQAPQGAWLPPKPEVTHSPPIRILQVQPQAPPMSSQTGQPETVQSSPPQQQTQHPMLSSRRQSPRSAPAMRQSVHVTPQWSAPPARATLSRPRSASVAPYYPPIMVQPQGSTRSSPLPPTAMFAAKQPSHAWEVPHPEEGATPCEPSEPIGASQPQAAIAGVSMPQPQQQGTVHVTPVRRLANAQGQSTWTPYNPYQGYRETFHEYYTPHEPVSTSPHRRQDQEGLPIQVGTGRAHYPSQSIAENRQPLIDAIKEELLRLKHY